MKKELLKTVTEIIEMCKEIKETSGVDFEDMIQQFDMLSVEYDWSELDKKFHSKYFDTWPCWDTMVGKSVVYFENEPIAITVKSGRKIDTEWYWLGENAYKKVETFLLSLPRTTQACYIHQDTLIPIEGDSKAAYS